MQESIQNFNNQFNFEPEIKNASNLRPAENFVIGGMGGSHLAAGILKSIDERLNIRVHRDYDLPFVKEDQKQNTLFIASSFSGNTEETVSFLESAIKENLNVAVVAKGGQLLEIAEQNNLPFIKLPDSDIQPRMALGWSLLAMSRFIKPDLIPALKELSRTLNPLQWHDSGEELAEEIKGKIPLIYASRQNRELARIWKIKFNETAKIPAFFNVFPELNHNEMTGFDHNSENKNLSENFFFIFLKDSDDHPRIQKRMEITAELFEERGLSVKTIDLEGEDRLQKIFGCLLLGDWTALRTAGIYNSEPDQVPMVEKFKKLIS